MPIRIASLSPQLHKNGARLHQIMASRIKLHGADHPPSEAEVTLREERHLLKLAKAERLKQAGAPKVKPVKVAKAPKAAKAAKAPKAPKEAKAAKTAKGNKPSRAEKLTKKAENAEAAKKATKKSAKT